jgi:bacterioferritin
LDKKEIVDLLNLDLQDEHGAIVQYLGHSYGIGEGELACEIESIARDEMRHLDWLAETIVELGGKPSLKRGTQNLTGQTVPDWMNNDVSLEDGAIKNYQAHIKAVDIPKVKRILKRILMDEQSHRAKFARFIDKTKTEGMKDIRGKREDSDAKVLNWGVGHEYSVVLQYMFHSYMTQNKDAKKQFEDQAINEMQHMGWLAEELAGGGGTPVIEHTALDLPARTAEMLQADIKVEKETAAMYDKAVTVTQDAGVKELLSRISAHEKYHIDVFSDLLNEERSK